MRLLLIILPLLFGFSGDSTFFILTVLVGVPSVVVVAVGLSVVVDLSTVGYYCIGDVSRFGTVSVVLLVGFFTSSLDFELSTLLVLPLLSTAFTAFEVITQNIVMAKITRITKLNLLFIALYIIP